ncbi:hypothetical protein EAE89_10270 [Photorhabdus heterorhabditis]|nr:hypothetical protein [Photorhabdus heterorhabditis]
MSHISQSYHYVNSHNEAGWIHADKNLTLDGKQGKITNRNNQPAQGISSLGELTITADTIDNQQGRVIADKQLNMTSTGTVDNTNGNMVSQYQQLNNAGLPDTKVNNNMIISKLLDSAKDVTPENRKTSVVVSGNNGSVRVYATWTILPNGSKRLATVQTGTFK